MNAQGRAGQGGMGDDKSGEGRGCEKSETWALGGQKNREKFHRANL